MENNFSIIISTCDKFSDLWDAHILLLNQNWADRNVETFLVTDKPTDRTFKNVTVVAAGEGTEITERLKAVMPLIKTEYILFTLDDYFLTESISTQAINEDIQIMEKHQMDYLRLFVMTMRNSNRIFFCWTIMQAITLSVSMRVFGKKTSWREH